MDFGVFSIVPMDFVILFVLWIVFAVIALQGGRGEVISGVLGAFVGIALFEFIQKALWISGMLESVLAQPRNAAIVLVVLVIFGYLVTRMLMLPYGSDLIGSPLQSATLGFLATAILLALWMVSPNTSELWQFGTLFQTAFAPIYTFWWIAGALALSVVFG